MHFNPSNVTKWHDNTIQKPVLAQPMNKTDDNPNLIRLGCMVDMAKRAELREIRLSFLSFPVRSELGTESLASSLRLASSPSPLLPLRAIVDAYDVKAGTVKSITPKCSRQQFQSTGFKFYLRRLRGWEAGRSLIKISRLVTKYRIALPIIQLHALTYLVRLLWVRRLGGPFKGTNLAKLWNPSQHFLHREARVTNYSACLCAIGKALKLSVKEHPAGPVTTWLSFRFPPPLLPLPSEKEQQNLPKDCQTR